MSKQNVFGVTSFTRVSKPFWKRWARGVSCSFCGWIASILWFFLRSSNFCSSREMSFSFCHDDCLILSQGVKSLWTRATTWWLRGQNMSLWLCDSFQGVKFADTGSQKFVDKRNILLIMWFILFQGFKSLQTREISCHVLVTQGLWSSWAREIKCLVLLSQDLRGLCTTEISCHVLLTQGFRSLWTGKISCHVLFTQGLRSLWTGEISCHVLFTQGLRSLWAREMCYVLLTQGLRSLWTREMCYVLLTQGLRSLWAREMCYVLLTQGLRSLWTRQGKRMWCTLIHWGLWSSVPTSWCPGGRLVSVSDWLVSLSVCLCLSCTGQQCLGPITCIYTTHTHTHMCSHTHTCKHPHRHRCMCTQTCITTHICTHTHTHRHSQTHTHTHTT